MIIKVQSVIIINRTLFTGVNANIVIIIDLYSYSCHSHILPKPYHPAAQDWLPTEAKQR